MVTKLRQWLNNFSELNKCPWPGPRPLDDDEEDAKHCIGRDEDADNLVLKVRDHRLVILHGDSGVGKSSLVNVKLVAALRDAGHSPIVCKKWSKEDQDETTETFLRRKILESLKERDATASINDSGDLSRDLEEAFSGMAVVIFDQFEELIRHKPELFLDVEKWILRTNKNCQVRIVLSLRSEFAHRLKTIEKKATPFSLSTVVIEPIENRDHIRQIIKNVPDENRDEGPISAEAVDVILNHWDARTKRSGDKWHGIGLLHLQALLYSLHALAKEMGDLVVGNGQIERFLKEQSQSDNSQSSKSFFDHGLREAVRRKLLLCEKACAAAGLDRVLIEGTNAAAYRMIPHLSSGGYKLEREAWNLAKLALDRELEQLVRDPKSIPKDAAENVYRKLNAIRSNAAEGTEDLLTISRRELARLHRVEISTSKPAERFSRSDDPTDATAGPLLGYKPGDVLIEEIRRVVFAQHWLEESQIVRTSSSDGRLTMLSLTHDGFADALEYWARFREPVPSDALYLLTAAKGREFDWLAGEGVPVALDGKSAKTGTVTLVNLRWQDCRVSAKFRRVVFVNCDFSGTRFTNCTFEGVSFVNCLLDKTSFEDCTIGGNVRRIEPVKRDDRAQVKEGRPWFRVASDRATISELDHYQLDGRSPRTKGVEHIYSSTSGKFASPWGEQADASTEFCREDGGLTMYGGRLSSLMIRACTFESGSRLSFRFIAGSSLDIVETSTCNLDMVSAAVRGLTITAAPDASSETEIDVAIHDTLINNCWFGDNLKGSARFDDCQVLQLLSLSKAEAFKVTIERSVTDGVRNAKVLETAARQRPSNWMADEGERKEVAEGAKKMDYRTL